MFYYGISGVHALGFLRLYRILLFYRTLLVLTVKRCFTVYGNFVNVPTGGKYVRSMCNPHLVHVSNVFGLVSSW